jgi:tetratricopeptide (TPR) repeat protein
MDSAAQQHADLGWDRLIGGDDAAAEAHFRAALDLVPDSAELLTGLAQVLRRRGLLRDAVLHCDAALRADPDYALAWLERGFVLAAGGSMRAASECYARVIALDPESSPAHAGLASILARDGHGAAATEHARRAIALDPDNAIATAALATVLLEAGDAAAARDCLLPLLARMDSPSADRVMLNGRLGDACNRLGDADQAFAAYSAAQADFAVINADRYAERDPHRAFITRITTAVETHTFAAPQTEPVTPGAASRHIFLLGYPRSGTTMVENVLASLPDVVALEERPTLREADQDFLTDDGGLARFAALGDPALARYRAAYWDRVARSGAAAAGRCFVDMDPLKATRLPLIARLFPDARILVMRRDPRDVVWSCFRTNFALTNAALDFTTLEGAARHYAAMMTLIERAAERLPVTMQVVRYEALVRDFDVETRAMCAFAGLEWSTDLRRFARTAQQRGVSTASAGQVRKGLYDGSAQWRPYAHHLEPVMPILAPWIEKFGYQ